MTEEKALVPAHSSLEVYGSGEDIRNLSKRIKSYLPGGNKLSENDALALAQLSVAYGLNPFNGEVWILVDRNGVTKGTMVGIKGLRKAARKQSHYWPTFKILTKPEKQELNIPEGAIAYRCFISRTDILREVAETVDTLYKAGMKNAFEIYVYQPAEGLGYWTPGEVTKMKPDQVARKRAEADALKVAFDLPFATEGGEDGEAVGYIDTEWEVQGTAPKLTGEALQTKVAENIRILRGDEGMSGFGDDQQKRQDLEEEELEEIFGEKDIPDDLPHDSLGFFGAVNKVVTRRYDTIESIAKVLKAHGKTGWPTQGNAEGWAECWRIIMDEDVPF